MRSSLIFSVTAKFTNRYQLCRMLAASARKLSRQGESAAQSINRSLQALHDSDKPGQEAAALPADTEDPVLKRTVVTAPAP